MEIFSSPGTWLLIGALFVVFVITAVTETKKKPKGKSKSTAPSNDATPEQVAKLTPQKPFQVSAADKKRNKNFRSLNAENSDRFFSNWQLAAGRKLADNRCEHTDTRTKKRCTNRWQEGDHFYDYAKGGATSERNLVGACLWHNDPTNNTLKKRNPELERVAIEKRRATYYPEDQDVTVGEWRNTGLRITFSIGERVCQLQEVELSVLVEDTKEALLTFTEDANLRAKISSVTTPGQLVDIFYLDKLYTLESLEGVDPLSGLWVPLRKPTNWALENLKADS